MNKSIELKCPVCGSAPELSWRKRNYGTCHGALKCPRGHHAVYQAYSVGSEEAAEKSLVLQWNELTKDIEGDAPQGA